VGDCRISKSGFCLRLQPQLDVTLIHSRIGENEIVAVILVLPEPFAVLALMNCRIKFGNWENFVATNEPSLVTKARKVGKDFLDAARREMPIFALEN
jgi:hypothetical protein